MNLHVFQSAIPIYNAFVWRKLGTVLKSLDIN